jgi:hypothetical protein
MSSRMATPTAAIAIAVVASFLAICSTRAPIAVSLFSPGIQCEYCWYRCESCADPLMRIADTAKMNRYGKRKYQQVPTKRRGEHGNELIYAHPLLTRWPPLAEYSILLNFHIQTYQSRQKRRSSRRVSCSVQRQQGCV